MGGKWVVGVACWWGGGVGRVGRWEGLKIKSYKISSLMVEGGGGHKESDQHLHISLKQTT